MSAFQLRHYTVRLRHSGRLRYRIPRRLWRAVRSVPQALRGGFPPVSAAPEIVVGDTNVIVANAIRYGLEAEALQTTRAVTISVQPRGAKVHVEAGGGDGLMAVIGGPEGGLSR